MHEYSVTKMAYTDVGQTATLISRAMNPNEGRWARKTMEYHFRCSSYGIDDGRSIFLWQQIEEASFTSLITGVVGLHHYAWGPEQNVWLSWFAIEPKLQGRGHGRALLEVIEAKATALGYTKLLVETYSSPDFDGARGFYAAQGFDEVGYIENYLNGADMIIYKKELNHAR